MQKVLIIGCSSMVGSRVSDFLKDTFAISCADKNADVNAKDCYELDITDASSVEKVFEQSGADIFLHFAAFTDVDKAEEQRGDENGLCWQLNVTGTENVVAAAKKLNKKLVYISTDYVFQGDSGPYAETDEPIANLSEGSWYGWTKRKGEMIVLNELPQALIVRIAYPFRADYDFKLDFVRKMIKRFKENKMYPQFTDQMISPVFIDDLGVALHQLLADNISGVYHIVGTSLSPYDAAVAVARTFGFAETPIEKGSLEKYITVHESAKLRYPKDSSLKNDKINALLSSQGKSTHTFEEALKIMKEQISTL